MAFALWGRVSRRGHTVGQPIELLPRPRHLARSRPRQERSISPSTRATSRKRSCHFVGGAHGPPRFPREVRRRRRWHRAAVAIDRIVNRVETSVATRGAHLRPSNAGHDPRPRFFLPCQGRRALSRSERSSALPRARRARSPRHLSAAGASSKRSELAEAAWSRKRRNHDALRLLAPECPGREAEDRHHDRSHHHLRSTHRACGHFSPLWPANVPL